MSNCVSLRSNAANRSITYLALKCLNKNGIKCEFILRPSFILPVFNRRTTTLSEMLLMNAHATFMLRPKIYLTRKKNNLKTKVSNEEKEKREEKRTTE